MSFGGTVLPVPLDSYDTTAESGLLGKRIQRAQDGKLYQYVKCNEANGVTGGRSLIFSDKSAYTVEYGTSLTDRVCGVVPYDANGLTIPNAAGFFMQVGGIYTGVKGDGPAIVAGEWVANDDDSDQGKQGGITLIRNVHFVDPGQFKTEAGLTLTGSTNVTIGQNSNKELILDWAAGDADFVHVGLLGIPADFDVKTDYIRIVALCTKAGTTDNRTLDAEVYYRAPGSAAAAFGADLNPTAAAMGAAAVSTPAEFELNLAGNSLLPGGVLAVQLAITNPGSTDAAAMFGAWLRYKTTEVPAAAFARAITAQASTDGTYTAEIIQSRLEAA